MDPFAVDSKEHIADTGGSIKDINEHCLQEFRTHWQCLENHNQQLWNCRSEERRLNKCVFDKLVRLPSHPDIGYVLTRSRNWRRRYQTLQRTRPRSISGRAISLRRTEILYITRQEQGNEGDSSHDLEVSL